MFFKWVKMEIKRLNNIVKYLETGTFPAEKELQEICSIVAVYYASFALHSREVKRSVSFHLMDLENNYGLALPKVHQAWTALVMEKVAKFKDVLVGDFQGVSAEKISETMEIYVTYTDILEHHCSWCKQVFSSNVNRYRCENSHVSRKNLEERSVLPIGALTHYWDSLDDSTRTSIASTATKFLDRIPSCSSFSRSICRLIALAAGKVDITGEELMRSLDEASEYTFLYRPARPTKPITISHRADAVAAIGDEVIKHLAQRYSDSVTETLLSEEQPAPKKVQPSVPKKKKKQRVRAKKVIPKIAYVLDEPEIEMREIETHEVSPETLLSYHISEQIKLEDHYSRDAYYHRLEKLIFSSPAVASIGSWADAFD